MFELMIFMVSAGPSVIRKNIEDTYQSLANNLGIDDFKFFVVLDQDETEKWVKEIIPEKHLFGISRSSGIWAKDFNQFLERYNQKALYLLIVHDDIFLSTPDTYVKTMAEIKGYEENIGWITYTNDGYHNAWAANALRGGFYTDRLKFDMYECRRGDRVFDYPSRAVKVYGPYSHMNLILFKNMLKIGPSPEWTRYTILLDEDWCLESLVKGLTNIWIPSVFYTHPNQNTIHERRSELRFTEEAHRAFTKKWGFDTPFSDSAINSFIKQYPANSYLANRYSYEWVYLKEA